MLIARNVTVSQDTSLVWNIADVTIEMTNDANKRQPIVMKEMILANTAFFTDKADKNKTNKTKVTSDKENEPVPLPFILSATKIKIKDNADKKMPQTDKTVANNVLFLNSIDVIPPLR